LERTVGPGEGVDQAEGRGDKIASFSTLCFGRPKPNYRGHTETGIYEKGPFLTDVLDLPEEGTQAKGLLDEVRSLLEKTVQDKRSGGRNEAE